MTKKKKDKAITYGQMCDALQAMITLGHRKEDEIFIFNGEWFDEIINVHTGKCIAKGKVDAPSNTTRFKL